MNRWIHAARNVPVDGGETTQTIVLEPSGPSRPQRGVEFPHKRIGLGRFEAPKHTSLWVLGSHGDAGEHTLSALLPGAVPAGHRWPMSADENSPTQVIVVCRSNHKGLTSARRAAIEFAAGTLPTVRVLGLVIIADLPGKQPKELRDLATVVAGGFPESWEFPWVETYRRGDTTSATPREITTIIQTITDRLSLASPSNRKES